MGVPYLEIVFPGPIIRVYIEFVIDGPEPSAGFRILGLLSFAFLFAPVGMLAHLRQKIALFSEIGIQVGVLRARIRGGIR